MIEQQYFDERTALSKVGKRIQTLVDFSCVPKGTRGVVRRADPVNIFNGNNGSLSKFYRVAIEWHLPSRCFPLVDWFTKDEYERYLEENVVEYILLAKPND
jgi:hypothetical protein